MKILALTRYTRLGASSRLRTYQYLSSWENEGFQVTVSPLFNDTYIKGLQDGYRQPGAVLDAYWNRLRTLFSARQYDLIWIEYECLPWLPALIERLFLSSKTPYIVDYDDAVFHYYDQHRLSIVRRILGNKHAQLIRRASLVIAGNEYLAAYARKHGAKTVSLIPTAVDLTRYPFDPNHSETRTVSRPKVCWIGQRSTAHFLRPLASIFSRLTSENKGEFVAIGIDAAPLNLPMTSIPWAEDTEVASIQSCDIGIMPLTDGPFERGKCGYKLIQYMACGLPVIASPVGVNKKIVEHGINGYLAESPEEWAHALERLLQDRELREEMGKAGRLKVEKEYCTQVTAKQLIEKVRQTTLSQK